MITADFTIEEWYFRVGFNFLDSHFHFRDERTEGQKGYDSCKVPKLISDENRARAQG